MCPDRMSAILPPYVSWVLFPLPEKKTLETNQGSQKEVQPLAKNNVLTLAH